MQWALEAGTSASRPAPALELLAADLGASLGDTGVHAGSPGHGRSFSYQLALTALVVALCASMAHGQSLTDSGRSASAGRAATLTNDSVGSFAGKVVQGNGTPLAGAVVSVFGASDSALTTSEGHFELHRLPFGAHMVSVRRLGFAVKRFALTITPDVAPEVTITMTPFVPILPTVTTTAEERAAYDKVGFYQRMQMGVGQFMTYDQIVRKQASSFTDLLRQMRGIDVVPPPGAPVADEDNLVGTRGVGSCVSYVVDGMPQHLVNGESPNRVIAPSDLGAIEVYSSAERPAGFGGMEEHPSPPPGAPLPTVGLDRQQCELVMVWTRTQLGLVGMRPSDGATRESSSLSAAGTKVTRGVTNFALDSTCKPPAAADTTLLLVYATIQGSAPRAVSDSVWKDYTARVQGAVDRWADLPSEVFLPSFSLPIYGLPSGGGHPEQEVMPALSTVLAFTLDGSGGLKNARIAASSLSDGADTSVLAAVEQAATQHAFPPLPPTMDSVSLYLVVESAEPSVATRAAVLGQLEVPAWRLTRSARLAHRPLPGGLLADSKALERVTVMMAVDTAGHVVAGTARLETGPAIPAQATIESRTTVLKRLPDVRFEPARIGACRVNEFVVQSFTPPNGEQH
jgi:hypothetical protein